MHALYGDKVVRGTRSRSAEARPQDASDACAAGALIKNSSGIVVDTIWVTCVVVNLKSPLSGLDSPNATHDFTARAINGAGFRLLSHLGGSNGNSN